MSRWVPRGQAALLAAVAATAALAAHDLVSLRRAVLSLVAPTDGADWLMAWWDLDRVHAVYWTVVVALGLVLVVHAVRRRVALVVATAVVLALAVATLPLSRLPFTGAYASGDATPGPVADPGFSVAIACWVVVAVGALALAVRTWRVPRPE